MARALLAGPRPQVNRAALRVSRTSRTTPAMHEKFTRMTAALYDCLVAHAPSPDAVLQELAAETDALGPISRMQVAVEEAAFLGWLARVIGARRAVEVGTFTGYSAIAMARGLPPTGISSAATSVRNGRPSPAATSRVPASPTGSR